jgi:hypothetical protein
MENTNTKKAVWINENGELVLVETESHELREMPKSTSCEDLSDVAYFESLCQ